MNHINGHPRTVITRRGPLSTRLAYASTQLATQLRAGAFFACADMERTDLTTLSLSLAAWASDAEQLEEAIRTPTRRELDARSRRLFGVGV